MGHCGAQRLDYNGKLILAPMVRMGTLPFRSLCLDYGANIVYSEEIVDIKLLQCTRMENPLLNTVDFANSEEIVFRTHSCERANVVLQIGTADAKQAAAVAKLVELDVAGFDINMGCPKDYSVKGGMGAALLRNPDLIEDILRQVRNSFDKSLTCKIRLLSNLQDTVNLVKRIEATGVDAIAVHGRTKEERPSHKNNVDAIRAIVNAVSIPVIANGGSSEIRCFDDLEKFRVSTGSSSVMIARAAQSIPSIFRRDGILSREQMIMDYLKKATDFDGSFRNTKYAIQQLFGDTSTELGQKLLATRDFRELCGVFSFEDYFEQHQISLGRVPKVQPGDIDMSQTGEKRPSNDDADYFSEDFDYAPISKKLKRANDTHTPKSILLEHCKRFSVVPPRFDFSVSGRTFCGKVMVDGKTYATTAPHKTKKEAEQAATVVALRHIIPGFQL